MTDALRTDVSLRTAALDRFFEHYYRRRPVDATFTGIHHYDAALPDWSPDGLGRTSAEMAVLRSELASRCVGAGAGVEEPEIAAIDCMLADAVLEIQIAELESRHFQRGNPALYTGEAVFGVLSLMLRDFAPAVERLECIAARLGEVPAFLDGARQSIGDRPIPTAWRARALGECDGAEKVWREGLEAWCGEHGIGGRRARQLLERASTALAAALQFRAWLESRPDAPARQSGCGPELFDLLLRRGHWDERSRHDLLAEARERFTVAAQDLHRLAHAQDSGGWPAVAERLATDHPRAEGYLDAFQRLWEECRDFTRDRDLVTWPDFPIRYVPIPAWVRAAAPHLYFLHYRSPAPFDDRRMVDYLVPPLDDSNDPQRRDALLRAVHHGVIKLNHVVHHGALGHHVQNFYAYRAPSRIGQVAAVDCASRIGMFCGGSMAEGWACYATDLMGEMGFLSDLELVAEQHARLRQLARAIVDIELHQYTMEEDDARRFYCEHIGLSPQAAQKEVTRNSMFPATAVMYWLGTQGIHDLRAARARTAGASFSLRAFHDELLSFGSLPVALIARRMSGVRLT